MKIKGYRTTLASRGKGHGRKFGISSEKPASRGWKNPLSGKSRPVFFQSGGFFLLSLFSVEPDRTVFTLSSFISENDGVK
jgi:hypothetical protein